MINFIFGKRLSSGHNVGPLDLHISNLQNFLLGNDKCCSNWANDVWGRTKQLRLLKDRIRVVVMAIKDNKNAKQLFQRLASGDEQFVERLTYFDCMTILQNLDPDGKVPKTYFGIYKDEHLKELCEIINQYKIGHLYLLDIAMVLEKITIREIPVSITGFSFYSL